MGQRWSPTSVRSGTVGRGRFSHRDWWNIHPRFFDQLLRSDPLYILWKSHQFLHFVMVKAPSFGEWVSEGNKQLFHYRIQPGEG